MLRTNLWKLAFWMGVILSSAALADVTVLKSNNLKESIESSLGSLLDFEQLGLQYVDPIKMAALTQSVPDLLFKPEPKALPKRTQQMTYFLPERLAALPKARGGKQWACLAQAIYFEARGESILGQAAVGEVILNRVESLKFPKTVCSVVHQSHNGTCQFSYMCDGRPEKVSELAAFETVGKIARALMDGVPHSLTEGATYFHAKNANPRWSKIFEPTANIGFHIFYRDPNNI
ncbi:MAG: cell wall hydrolase [Paracoccaceae bacterium]